MNLQPLGDRLIVQPLDEEQTTVGGIVLPDTAQEKPQRGTVLAVGPGTRNRDTGEYIPLDVVEGDVVVFNRYGPTEFKFGVETYWVVKEIDLIAKVVGSTSKKSRQPAGATA